jgi:hypothetical protein
MERPRKSTARRANVPVSENRVSLFDHAESQRRAEEGMERAASAAPPSYSEIGILCLRKLAHDNLTFTADDWWEAFERRCLVYGLDPSRNRDASGAVFQRAYREKIIQQTGMYQKSKRPEAHSKMLPVLTTGARTIYPCYSCKGTGIAQ